MRYLKYQRFSGHWRVNFRFIDTGVELVDTSSTTDRRATNDYAHFSSFKGRAARGRAARNQDDRDGVALTHWLFEGAVV